MRSTAGSSPIARWCSSVERFRLETTPLQRLAELPRAAIEVESDYPDLFRTQRGRGSWLADNLGRLAIRYPEVPVVFAGSRKFAEEWAYRFFGAAVANDIESS